jgi:hypothetical protein
MNREPSPLMTPAEVAHLWRVTSRTVRARVKPGAPVRNRIEPIYTTPDLRWDRAAVLADLERAKKQPVSVIHVVRGRERRTA